MQCEMLSRGDLKSFVFPSSGWSVAVLSAAMLLLETSLTRLLAVAQFYHFAFLAVSLALLGFGASGSLLTAYPRIRSVPVERTLIWAGLGFALSTALAYAAVNLVPFDSYRIVRETRQVLYFAIYYLALAMPFLCAGVAIGAALSSGQSRSHLLYAANLGGSAAGALLAPAVLWFAGVPGAILASCLLALLPAMRSRSGRLLMIVGTLGVAGLITLGYLNLHGQGVLGLALSPYKGLSHALRYPGSFRVWGQWSALGRVDVIANAGTRQFPGLSYIYTAVPPAQLGLSVDGDSLQPITRVYSDALELARYLPEAPAFAIHAEATALVVEPVGGLGVLQALAGGAIRVDAVASNPSIRHAVSVLGPEFDVFQDERVHVIFGAPRPVMRRSPSAYDVVSFPLTDAYRPIQSGAYSLSETYLLTLESFRDALRCLKPDGILVITRWLQLPPSEDLRLIATLVEALENSGFRPADALVAYRGIQTLTVFVRPAGWNELELKRIRAFTESRRYDLVWMPDIQFDEVNRYNRMPTPEHFEKVRALLFSSDRKSFYAAYPYAIAPAIDDRPFFFHFFKWNQTLQVLAELGHTWQPFGGSGYFILFVLLGLVIVFSFFLILLPASLLGYTASAGHLIKHWPAMAYFTLIGLAFLFIEIPIIQRSILLFDHPTYAFSIIVCVLLFFSGIGSAFSRNGMKLRRAAWPALVIFSLLSALGIREVANLVLNWPLGTRIVIVTVGLMPLAMSMGLPFPLGLAILEKTTPSVIPLAWAINGCASVVASVLAAILALSYGYTFVMVLGIVIYVLAGLLYWGFFARPTEATAQIGLARG